MSSTTTMSAGGRPGAFGKTLVSQQYRFFTDAYKSVSRSSPTRTVLLGLSHNQDGHPGSLLPIITILGAAG